MKSRSRLTAFLLLATTGWAAPNLADVVNQAYQGLCDAKNYSWSVMEGKVGVAPKIRSSSPILPCTFLRQKATRTLAARRNEQATRS